MLTLLLTLLGAACLGAATFLAGAAAAFGVVEGLRRKSRAGAGDALFWVAVGAVWFGFAAGALALLGAADPVKAADLAFFVWATGLPLTVGIAADVMGPER